MQLYQLKDNDGEDAALVLAESTYRPGKVEEIIQKNWTQFCNDADEWMFAETVDDFIGGFNLTYEDEIELTRVFVEEINP